MNLRECMSRISAAVYSDRGLVVLAAIFAVSVGVYAFVPTLPVQQDQAVLVSPESVSSTSMPAAMPTRLRIPKLTIDTSFVAPLGLLDNGEIEVPESYTDVGWYQYGPTPGELGPAVVVGHVDSYTGPAVFFYLGQLEPGDDIYIDRDDGTTAHFVVESLERPKQSAFPTARVYGDLNYAGLRLITCSGIYERGKQRYTHNLIVYARLQE